MDMPRPWVQMPTDWIRSDKKLHNFTWASSENQRSTALAALELYICICMFCTRQATAEQEDDGDYSLQAELSYSNFSQLTGMSRALISKGLDKLVAEELVEISTRGRRNVFHLVGFSTKRGWCKLPARSLLDGAFKIRPFHRFTRRSKYELYAVKMFLLLAANRDNRLQYSCSTYDTIEDVALVPRNSIKRAQTLMLTSDLLEKADFEKQDHSIHKAANRYYLPGHQSLAVVVTRP